MSLSIEEEVELFQIDSDLLSDVYTSTLKLTGYHSYGLEELFNIKLEYKKLVNEIKIDSNILPNLNQSQQNSLYELLLAIYLSKIHSKNVTEKQKFWMDNINMVFNEVELNTWRKLKINFPSWNPFTDITMIEKYKTFKSIVVSENLTRRQSNDSESTSIKVNPIPENRQENPTFGSELGTSGRPIIEKNYIQFSQDISQQLIPYTTDTSKSPPVTPSSGSHIYTSGSIVLYHQLLVAVNYQKISKKLKSFMKIIFRGLMKIILKDGSLQIKLHLLL